MKTIILCADDFSLNPAINTGVLDLLAKERLSAVSCMAQSPSWLADAQSLSPWLEQVDIGLHFNLTQPFYNSFSLPLAKLMLQSKLRVISKPVIHESFCRQLDAFEAGMKTSPDFIDGHQHVHVFPVICDIIVEEYLRRYGKPKSFKPYMRSLENLPTAAKIFKTEVIQMMGTHSHSTLLRKNAIPHNPAFAGIYDFNPDENLDKRMNQWLNACPANSLIMCHPAHRNHTSDDEIALARFSEYNYLSSELFTQTLLQQQVTLTRFQD